jgi:putative aldouronate transport system substrate-binding protein
MNQSRRLAFVLLIVVLTISMLAACSGQTGGSGTDGNADATGNAGSADNSGSAETAKAIQDGTYKFETPVTISTVRHTDPTYKFKNGDNLENNVHTKWAKEKLGIDIKLMWQVPEDQFANKVRLMLTSGEKLPDVINTKDVGLMSDLIASGQFQDISEAFDQYASPELKKLYEEHPELWEQVTVDGKKMAYPYFENVGNVNGLLWIRQDWLDKLSMKAPTTIEEMEALMEAFLKQDPSGKGDIIPLGLALKGARDPVTFTKWYAEGTWLFGPNGTIPESWIKGEDGSLVWGSIQPGMKEGLLRLNDWYKKGYISKEAGLHDENKVTELTSQGRIAMVVAPWWLPNFPLPDMRKNNPGAEMVPYPLPTINGKMAAQDWKYRSAGMLVNKNFKHLDALFLYLNRLYAGENPKPGSEFEKGWAEGYDYVLKDDGTVSVNDSDIPGGHIEVFKYFLMEMKDPFMLMRSYAKLGRGEQPANNYEKKGVMTTPYPEVFHAVDILEKMYDQGTYIPSEYTGLSTPTMQSKNAILQKLENEFFVRIIYGNGSIDEFDDFVKEWKSVGGDAITKEVNDWYSARK